MKKFQKYEIKDELISNIISGAFTAGHYCWTLASTSTGSQTSDHVKDWVPDSKSLEQSAEPISPR